MTTTLLVILAISLVAGWFFTTHEKVEQERWVGLRGVASVNDYHAAELLLKELGFEAESRPTLTPTEWMPDPADTIIVHLSQPIALGEERLAVLDWIAAGGHMVFLPPAEHTNDVGSFLEGFALQFVEYDEDETVADDAEYDNEYAIDSAWGSHYLQLIGADSEAEVVLNNGRIFVARREYQDGYVTVMSDSFPFENLALESADNARLFADVVVGSLEPGKVWISYDTTFSPLWQLIWNAAPLLVVAIALLIALWIWYALPAFGPKAAGETASRRSIIEHTRASGIFTWRKHGASHLMESSTQALIHDAAAKHPGLAKRSAEEQAEIIARITGMSAQKVMDALHGHPDPKHREFTNSMQKLQSIRKEL